MGIPEDVPPRNPLTFRRPGVVQVPLLAFFATRDLAALSRRCPRSALSPGTTRRGGERKQARLERGKALDFARAPARHPTAVVLEESRVGDASLLLEPRDPYAGLQRHMHEGILRRVQTALADAAGTQGI